MQVGWIGNASTTAAEISARITTNLIDIFRAFLQAHAMVVYQIKIRLPFMCPQSDITLYALCYWENQ